MTKDQLHNENEIYLSYYPNRKNKNKKIEFIDRPLNPSDVKGETILARRRKLLERCL